MVVPGEHANVFEVPRIWWITTGCDYGVLLPMVVRFEFVSLLPLKGCITMHYSHPQSFVDSLYNPICKILNKFFLAIIIGSGIVISHWT